MNNTVHIEVGPREAKVHSPFEAKEAIKCLPQGWRKWDETAKVWIVQLLAVAELTRILKSQGFTVRTTKTESGRAKSGHTPPPRASRAAGTWADLMYAALSPELAAKAYKALLPVLHPDRGGSNEAMQSLNAARDKAAVSR